VKAWTHALCLRVTMPCPLWRSCLSCLCYAGCSTKFRELVSGGKMHPKTNAFHARLVAVMDPNLVGVLLSVSGVLWGVVECCVVCYLVRPF